MGKLRPVIEKLWTLKVARRPDNRLKLVLHLGTEKSGTTALQKWLTRNHEFLVKKGIWVCHSLEKSNNFGLVILGAGLEAGPDLTNEINVHDEGALDEYMSRKSSELAAEVALATESGCHTFIISSEHLHSRVRKEEQAQKVRDVLEPHFGDTQCILVLRPQADLSRSVQSNHFRWGVPVSSKSFLDTATGHNYDYNKIFQIWTHSFGQAPRVVPYKSNPDIVKWLCDWLRIDASGSKLPTERTKTAVTIQSAAILNALKPVLPRGPKLVELREKIIDRTCGGETLSFSRGDAETITHRFAKQNEQLCKRTLDITIEELQPDLEGYPEVGNIEKIAETDCSDILEKVFTAGATT